MSTEASPAESSSAADRAWLVWLERALLAAIALSLLYAWGNIVVYFAQGLYRTIRIWIVGAGVGGIVLLFLANWHARRYSNTAAWESWKRILALAWILIGLAMCARFTSKPTIAAGDALANLWLLWVWLMFFVDWSWKARLGVLGVLLAVAACFVLSVRTELDGFGYPNVVWKVALLSNRPTVESAKDESTATATQVPIEDTASYPRFRGAHGLATVHGVHLARDWSKQEPVLKWKHSMGAGWSAFAVDGNQALTQEQRGEEECVVCYDRNSGRQLWLHSDPAHYTYSGTGDGPRATPTIDGRNIYTLGATGILNCLDRETGKSHWSVNIATDTKTKLQPHGAVGSPLVVDNLVVVCPGGTTDASLVAYDKTNGKQVWQAGTDLGSYTSPMLVELGGVRQVLIVNAETVNSHDPKTGEILWTFPWANDQLTNCSQPFPLDDHRVFLSTAYGKGCAVLEVSWVEEGSWKASSMWTSRTMQTKFCSVVVRDGHAYGFDDGILECVSLADGRRKWKRGRYGHGQLMLVDDLLLIQAEDGRIVLVEAAPDQLRELASFQAIEGKTWNNPALVGRQLFVRNDHEAACFELPLEPQDEPRNLPE